MNQGIIEMLDRLESQAVVLCSICSDTGKKRPLLPVGVISSPFHWVNVSCLATDIGPLYSINGGPMKTKEMAISELSNIGYQ